MLYCFIDKYINGKQEYNDEIKFAISKKCFIYYNREKDLFLDENDNVILVKNKEVFPVVFVNSIHYIFDALNRHGAITCNTLLDIEKLLIG